jgi:SulP family sulfate permease
MEALLSAVVADGMSGNVHDPNRVISAHGIANLATAAFGCLPATAAIARTATNVRSGATSALSGLTHSVLLLLILVFLGRWAALIPLSCLAAILVVVAYHLLDWRSLRALLKSPRSDIAVLFTTMGITLFVDLATGIQVGVALAGALFIQRMSDVTDVNVVSKQFLSDRNISWAAPPSGDLPKGIDVYEINGPFFFGAVYKLREALHAVRKAPMVRILRMAKVSAMDSTGLHALEELWALSKKQKTTLIISEIHAQPFIALTKSDLIAKFGEQNVLATYELAIARARELIQARSTV